MTDHLLTLNEVADRLRRSPASLRWMRHTGNGPPSATIGGRIMYRQSELEDWIDQQFTSNGHTREAS